MVDKELDSYELTIENVDIDGIVAMSIVGFPAIEKNFILMNKEGESLKYNFAVSKFDNLKNTITGPAMIPNKKMYRFDQFTGKEWDIFFSEETIKQIAEDFLNKSKFNNMTIDHGWNANGIKLIELWLINDPENDKANSLGFKDLVKGTLMLSYKVENETVLNLIKNGDLNGFSIEAFITSKLYKKVNGSAILDEIQTILNKDITDEEKYLLIKEVIDKDENIEDE